MSSSPRGISVPPPDEDITHQSAGVTGSLTGDPINVDASLASREATPAPSAVNSRGSATPPVIVDTMGAARLTPSMGVTLKASTTVPAIHSHVVAELAAMSDEDRIAVFNASGRALDPDAAAPSCSSAHGTITPSGSSSGILFSSDNEISANLGVDSGASRYQLFNHPAVLQLASLGQHLPLSLFLNESAKRLFIRESSIPRRPHYTTSKPGVTTKSNVLDIDNAKPRFPDEDSLDPADWVEAWVNLKKFFEATCDEGVYERWCKHYDFCAGRSHFRENFPAIRRFDIRVRKVYSATHGRIEVSSDSYQRTYTEYITHSVTEAISELRRAQSGLSGSADRSRTSTPARRIEPYSRPSSSSSHRRGQRESRTAGENSPICLICARSGHRFSECVETASESAVTLSTSARSAGRSPTTHVPVPASEASLIRNLIVTPYNADAFESNLRTHNLTHRFPNLVNNLRHGFPLGYDMHPIGKTFTPKNHPSASLHRDQVMSFLKGEREAGRMSGPFTRNDTELIFDGPFRTSPIHVVVTQKADGSPKYRITINLSFPDEDGVSVNDMIESDDFPTTFNGPRDVEQIIINAPRGTQAAALDVASAFRTIPLRPEHKRYVVIMFDGLFWIDHCACFGCTSSGGNQGCVADATVAILDAKGIGPIPKWVDDFAPFRYPTDTIMSSSIDSILPDTEGTGYNYSYDLVALRRTIEDLHIPWHDTKGQDFCDILTYVGLCFDISSKEVWLPDPKRLKFKKRVDDFLSSYAARPAPQEDAMKINGSLSHAAFVYPHGRSYLSNLSTWIAKFSSRFQRRYIPHSVLSDLRWWSEMLGRLGWTRVMYSLKPPLDLHMSVDASSEWGIGLVMGDEWDAWRLTDRPRSPSQHIGWLEALAVEFAVRLLHARGYTNTHLLIRSDNQGVIGAWRRGRGKNFLINLSIRRTEHITLNSHLDISLDYIASCDNPADPISRGKFPDSSQRLPKSFDLPAEVSPYLRRV